jgi:hypothetical protein
MFKRLLTRFFSARRKSHRKATVEAEIRRQEIVELRRRLRDRLHHRLEK